MVCRETSFLAFAHILGWVILEHKLAGYCSLMKLAESDTQQQALHLSYNLRILVELYFGKGEHGLNVNSEEPPGSLGQLFTEESHYR